MAGFNTLKIISPLIERLYDSYHLSDKLAGYPSKPARQKTADEVTALVSELLEVYQTGNYLAALGHYEMAAHSYEYILDYYLGNEIYNNLGVLYASQAMVFSGKQVDKYVYPFELDTETRLATPRADALSPKEAAQRKALLKMALSYFDKALIFDQRNTQAYINRMCVQIQQGNYNTVTDLFQSGHMGKTLSEKQATNKEQGDARLMAAIAFAMSSETNLKHISSAKNLFRELVRHNDPQVRELALLNESIYLETYKPKPASPSCTLSKGTRRIDGVSALSHISVEGKWLDDMKQAEMYWEKLPQSRVSVSRWMGNPLVIQRIDQKNISAPGAVRVGHRAEVLLQQSQPADYRLIPTGTGYYIHFSECRVIFAINEKGYISEWARYFD